VSGLLWAGSGSGGSDSSLIVGVADDVGSSTGNGDLYGFGFDTTGISGSIDQVELIWSHSVPDLLNDDSVSVSYGFGALTIVKSVYDLGSTPVDLQGLIESEWFVVDVSLDRSWVVSDFAGLWVGGSYNKVKGPDSSWSLDAAGVRITYTP